MKNKFIFKIKNIIFKLKAMYYIKINKKTSIMPIKETTRRVGKTEFMIKYAKKHGYTVICNPYHRMKQLKQEYGYDDILTVNEIMQKGLYPRNIMIDEPIIPEDIEKIVYYTRHQVILAYSVIHKINNKQLKRPTREGNMNDVNFTFSEW